MNIPQKTEHIEGSFESRSKEAWRYKRVEHNQNFVVMSIVEAVDDNPAAVKIYGMYSSLEEANRVSEEISHANDYYHVYVASSNEWLPIPPTKEFIENVVYQEERMQNLHESYTKKKERNVEEMKRNMEEMAKKSKDAKNVVSTIEEVDGENETGVEETKG